MITARLFAALPVLSTGATTQPADWTILFYGAANNSCEETIMDDIAAMKRGFLDGQGVELVLLVDRAAGFSDDAAALGEDFQDTRLYRITHDAAERLDGAPELPDITRSSSHEANVGDAATLRQFLRFGKAHFPARNYALVFYSHGSGPTWGYDSNSKGDPLCSAELTRVLEEQDSVDLMCFDVCSMGGVENLYQWRPGTGDFSARVVVASPSVSGPLPYEAILARLHRARVGALDPSKATALELGREIVRAKHAQVKAMPRDRAREVSFEAWSCYDLAHVGALKAEVDALARELASPEAKKVACDLRGFRGTALAMNYMPPGEDAWASLPYFDLGDLARRFAESAQLTDAARARAKAVLAAIPRVVTNSFGMSLYFGFEEQRNGLYVLFPDGDEKLGVLRGAWSRFDWYSPRAASENPTVCPGLAWCADGAGEGNQRIESWFELLDSWFDDARNGGSNRYLP
ncbi:MAG: clostripain-related cysteine peptidase [Planctomycetota bacterium]